MYFYGDNLILKTIHLSSNQGDKTAIGLLFNIFGVGYVFLHRLVHVLPHYFIRSLIIGLTKLQLQTRLMQIPFVILKESLTNV